MCEPQALASDLLLDHAGRRVAVRLPLAGAFQVQNALVAAGLALATGGAPDAVFAALEHLEGVPGRLEFIGRHKDASIFVDYAHKPDALDKVLTTLRPSTTGRLIAVFGCGGDRDKGKRPIMGEVAARLADVVIVTDDNPRSEEAAAIRRAILEPACPASRCDPCARSAIAAPPLPKASPCSRRAMCCSIAGKGHETGQIIGDKVLPFSDQQSVRAALREFAA